MGFANLRKTLNLLFALSLAGCYGQGTDEAGLFGGDIDAGDDAPSVDAPGGSLFPALFSTVLSPKCLRCHTDYKNEAAVQKWVEVGDPKSSRLYQEVESNRMPKGGGALSSEEKSLIERYILSLKKKEPEPSPTPTTVPLEASWKSLKVYLFHEKSCVKCHYTNNMEDLTPFDKWESVKNSTLSIEQRMIRDVGTPDVMPPPGTSAEIPSDKIKSVYMEWVANGAPQN